MNLRSESRGTPQIDVVSVGILVADAIARPVERLPRRGTLSLVEELSLHGGGGALSAATLLVRFGTRVALVGKVGADPFGDFLLALLSERGIESRWVVRSADDPTSATVVLVDGAGQRTFLHLVGANGALQAADVDRTLLRSSRCLLVSGALVLPSLDGAPLAALLAEARAAGALTVLDTVFDPTGRWERVLPSLAQVDLFLPSLAEARAIAGRRAPAAVARRLRELGARAVVLKLGADGSYASGEGFEGHVPAFQVATVDETGAGDAFVAGVVHATLAGRPLEQAARLGNACGALATTAYGATEGVTGLPDALRLAGLAAD